MAEKRKRYDHNSQRARVIVGVVVESANQVSEFGEE